MLFTPYLAKTLDDKEHIEDHNYCKIHHLENKYLIEQQYADDIAFISICNHSINIKVEEASIKIQKWTQDKFK